MVPFLTKIWEANLRSKDQSLRSPGTKMRQPTQYLDLLVFHDWVKLVWRAMTGWHDLRVLLLQYVGLRTVNKTMFSYETVGGWYDRTLSRSFELFWTVTCRRPSVGNSVSMFRSAVLRRQSHSHHQSQHRDACHCQQQPLHHARNIQLLGDQLVTVRTGGLLITVTNTPVALTRFNRRSLGASLVVKLQEIRPNYNSRCDCPLTLPSHYQSAVCCCARPYRPTHVYHRLSPFSQ